jgi:hypothetical protein
MDDAMRCDRCRAEVTYESVRLGHDRLCEECVEEVYQGALAEIDRLKAALAERESLAYGGLLAKLHAIQDAAGGRDVDVVDVLHSYALAVADEAKRRTIAAAAWKEAEANAAGYRIQATEFLARAKMAEARLALIRERWSAWQKVRVLGICIGERMRLPGAAPDAIIDALDEACQG